MGLFDFFKEKRFEGKFNNETLRVAVKKWLKNPTKAEKKYGHISGWDTSEVTDMSELFLEAHDFDESLNDWDVSNVTTMKEMFSGAESFNQPLEKWDVSNVTDMKAMFFGAKSFSQPFREKIENRIFIGLGGPGYNILNDFETLKVLGEKICFSNKTNSITNKNIQVIREFNDLLAFLNPFKSIYLTGVLGGSDSSYIVKLIKYLSDNQINYQAVFCKPFKFEGRRVSDAEKTFRELEEFRDIKIMSLQKDHYKMKNETVSDALFHYSSEILKLFHFKNNKISHHF